MGFDCRVNWRYASALLLLSTATWASAAPASVDSTAPPGARPCAAGASLPASWSASERWVWGQICQRRAADFDAALDTLEGSGRQTDDRFGDARRKLGADFLRTVLVREPFRSAVPPEGVRITGANLVGDIDLRDAVLVRVFGIVDSKVVGKFVMNRLHTPTSVAFSRSTFEGDFSLHSANIGGHLNMTGSAFGEVVLQTVEIGGGVSMTGSHVTGRLNMDGATVGGALFMRNATFADVILTRATVGRELSTRGSTFNGTLEMANLSTGGHLLFDDAIFRGQVSGGLMTVGQDLVMTGATFERPAELTAMRVAGDVNLAGAMINALNLYGSTVGKDLVLADLVGPSVQWRRNVDGSGLIRDPMLILLDTSVGGLLDNPRSWPANLDLVLRDFRYERLLPFGKPPQGFGQLRDAAWYIDWLARDHSNSFQPYWQLAKTLKAYGEGGKAHEVLIAGRERQRLRLPWMSLERWWLWALRWLIAYGYGAGELQALFWATPFFLFGGVLAQRRAKPDSDGNRPGFWYSLDMLLPGMWLNENHPKLTLDRGARWYFNVHRLVGYVLLLFVVAGLAGLTE